MQIVNEIKKRNSGYALLETIFYVSLFTILSVAVINSMITMTRAFKETAIQVELMQGGDIMERISREARGAISVSSISASSLKLNSKDSMGVDRTVEFALSGSDVRFSENGVLLGNLNSGNTAVPALSFVQVNTAQGTAVKISLMVRSKQDSENRAADFYNTVVLRGVY